MFGWPGAEFIDMKDFVELADPRTTLTDKVYLDDPSEINADLLERTRRELLENRASDSAARIGTGCRLRVKDFHQDRDEATITPPREGRKAPPERASMLRGGSHRRVHQEVYLAAETTRNIPVERLGRV